MITMTMNNDNNALLQYLQWKFYCNPLLTMLVIGIVGGLVLRWSIISQLEDFQPLPAYYLFQTQPIHECLHEILHQENASWGTLVIRKIDFRHNHCCTLQMINIRLSGWLPKFWSSSVLIPPCESRNLDAELCKMTDLRCIMILLARTLVSH